MKKRDYTALDRLIMGFEKARSVACGDGSIDWIPASAGMTSKEAGSRERDTWDGVQAERARGMTNQEAGSREREFEQMRAEPGSASQLDAAQKLRSAALMRVNHAGEVAAQALYAGHAVTARDARVRAAMLQAAAEEGEHLHWCRQRVGELDSHVSYLTPAWYFGSFAIGALAGAAGDKWNLGFVMETERQVVQHLDKHLQLLPEQDQKSRAILQQMRQDELQHASAARAAGAAVLPWPLRMAMRGCAKVMTGVAYWV